MIWSIWCGEYESSSWRSQYSHRCPARSATNRRCDSLKSVAKLGVLTCPRFCHDHDVLKLQVVVEFGLLLRRDATVLRALHQFCHPLLDTVGRTKCDYGFRRGTCRDKIDDFVV